MSLQFGFGIPTETRTRKRKVEKYNFPVITTSEVKGKNFTKRISFNPASLILIGMDKSKEDETVNKSLSISFGFEKGLIYLANTSGIKDPNAIRFSKTSNEIANKKTYEHIIESLDLDDTVENEFKLEETGESYGGYALFQLVLLTNEEKALAQSIEKQDKEASIENTSEGESVQLPGAVKESPKAQPKEDRVEEVAVPVTETVVKEAPAEVDEFDETPVPQDDSFENVAVGNAPEAKNSDFLEDDSFFL